MFRNLKDKPKDSCREIESLYNGPIKRSQPNSARYSQNLDFSHFPLLCETIWKKLMEADCALRKRMPYCIFLHAMNEYLNAYLIDVNRYEGVSVGLDNFDSLLQSIEASLNLIPTQIFKYIDGIGKVKTTTGSNVYFNLPVGGTPQGPLDATDDEAAMESGSFGSCTAETHNSYECYVSPFVTRKLIERTLYANTTTDPDRFGDWSPLSKGRYPENGIATINLLGYQKPEKLDADGVAALRDLYFCNNDTPIGRISHCSKVLSRVTATLSRFHQIIEISNAHFYLPQVNSPAKDNSAVFIYNCSSGYSDLGRGTSVLTNGNLISPERFDRNTGDKAKFSKYKRRRCLGLIDPCYTVDGKVPKGWLTTRNDNFNMLGTFAPRSGLCDKASLRSDGFQYRSSVIKFRRRIQISARIFRCTTTALRQTFDFSTFPLLCEKTWELFELEDRDLRKRMPYCLFLHAMTEILNTTIKTPGTDRILRDIRVYIPSVIYEYIAGIGSVKTATGLDVYFNLPIGGTPQGPLDATDDEAEMESGSFGSCTAETHNSYECYVSPFVTRKLIERTLYANTTTDPDRYGDWSPLPKGRYPENGIANRNLLGYQKPEKLDADGVAALTDLDFCNDTTYGWICHSKKALKRVSDTLLRLSQKFDMVNMCTSPNINGQAKHKSAAFICLNFRGTIAPGDRLAPHVDILMSPESFRETTANKAYYFGYKRKRSPGSVGPCYTVGGAVPEGWEETRNDNYNMLGTYVSNYDKVNWCDDDHISFIKSNRESDISTWLSCYFWKLRLKKMKEEKKEEKQRIAILQYNSTRYN